MYLHLDPVVATLGGAALLGERVSGVFVASFAVVALGVALVNARGAAAPRRRARCARGAGSTETSAGP